MFISGLNFSFKTLLNEYLGEKTPALITVFFFVCSRRNVHWSIHILRNFPCPKTFLVVHLNTISLYTISLDLNITGHCDESTRIAVFPLVSISGAYFILKFQGAVVIRGRRLKEGGTYFKVRRFTLSIIHSSNYSRFCNFISSYLFQNYTTYLMFS